MRPPARLLLATLLLCLALAAATPSSVLAASAIGPAKALGGSKKVTTTAKTTAGAAGAGKQSGKGPSKEEPTTVLGSPTGGGTVPVEKPTPLPEAEPLPQTPGGPVYWGATIGEQLTGTQAPWDMSAVSSFEATTHHSLSLVQFFQPFSSCSGGSCSFYSFPTTPLENIRRHGAIPVLSWSSQSIPSSVEEPEYQLSDLISGRYDSYIREFAAKAKAWGNPFFLRFDWEMNGNWFPWSEGVNGNKPGEYAAAWRHVHDIFSEVGASNVTWVWCPNVDWNGNVQSIGNTYPGNAYVDWIGLDGYNWGTNPSHPGGWQSFDQLYRSSYRYLVESVAPTKPMMIAEVASSEYGGSKAAWIREMLTKVPTEYRDVRALLWFDKYDDGMDWPIESSSAASAAFAEGIQSPSFVGNSFSSLSTAVIQPAAS
ncbi:MAG TPA: glycosyl hydrolase [Solirubrobacterales bacterium]